MKVANSRRVVTCKIAFGEVGLNPKVIIMMTVVILRLVIEYDLWY